MKKGLISTAIIASLVTSSALYAQDGHGAKEKKAYKYKAEKQLAKESIKTLLAKFKVNFTAAMKKGGPVGATNFCADSAEELTASVNKELKEGVSIKRITLLPRNEKNLAKGSEAEILKAVKELQNSGVVLPKMLVQKIDDKHTRVIKPIGLKPMCIVCHGAEEKIDKEALKTIKAKYPNDKAIGYKVGDLRGAFVVDIIKK